MTFVNAILRTTLAVQFALTGPILVSTSASAHPSDPYHATICCGDYFAARIAYGEDAQATVVGHDAIPMFTDVGSYDMYYRSAGDKSCDEQCVNQTYELLRSSDDIELVPIGRPVSVLASISDPEDADYSICRVRLSGRTRVQLVLCFSLRPL